MRHHLISMHLFAAWDARCEATTLHVDSRKSNKGKRCLMAKGSPTITIRLNHLKLAAVQAEIARLNSNPLSAEWTMTAWIHKAIEDRLDHSLRSRKPAKPRRRKAGKNKTALKGQIAEKGKEIH